MESDASKKQFINTVLFFGGIWGLIEASLGYVLHIFSSFVSLPSLSGMILFPIGLYLMYRSMKSSGQSAAVLLTALVAAAIKSASVLLPFVSFRFVRNPAIAILLEGLAAWVVISSTSKILDRWLPAKAILLSIGWRTLFLAINIGFGLSGIANKPAALQWNFLLLGGGIDALLIVTAVYLHNRMPQKSTDSNVPWRVGTASAIASVLAGFGGQALFLSL